MIVAEVLGLPAVGTAAGVVSTVALVFTGLGAAAGSRPEPAGQGGRVLRLGRLTALAAAGFALFGPVDWAAAAPLAAGFPLGGWIGPGIARRLPGHSLRHLAAACGLAVAVKQGYDAYAR
ncbi:hypothetical protein [Nonomuraea pusilla]|uniref:Uncharacterized protein n=1 Tax=Nonomuraea pusilla TaxID=46177 RepID=A0A1H7KEN2_9ACTN|nr:hypothetical protein [Nonomuraea pusilla]SEK84956.1 hypothetical protein SAMN05660976_01214 [Nonomuraea pusilla]